MTLTIKHGRHPKWIRAMISILLCIDCCFAQSGLSNSSGIAAHSCAGLHAGIQAQIAPGAAQPSVMVSFLLLNDGEKPIDVAEKTWKIIIDGSVLTDSGMIFGNGPAPAGGWTALSPGANYQLGKALPISTYFPKKGNYKVSWKGLGFQSSTIVITIE